MLPAIAPEDTRQRLLLCAFEEIHKRGFRAASLDAILQHSGLTKGALYYHFANKTALGYAVVEEIIHPFMREQWDALAGADDPLDAAQQSLRRRRNRLRAKLLAYGCPFNNLAQEMSPIDPGFRQRLQAILDEWVQALSSALQRGQTRGKVRADVQCEAAAVFVISALEGLIGMAKTTQSEVFYQGGMRGLVDYLDHLRPAAALPSINPHAA